MRPLNTGDYERGFLKLLEQLTNVGDVTKEMFLGIQPIIIGIQ